MSFKLYLQQYQMDCGPTCLRMVASHYGRSFSLQKLRKLSEFSREGVSLLGIADAAENIGFRATGVKINNPLAHRKVRIK
jgi:ATP-binding cassette subfamily B protein